MFQYEYEKRPPSRDASDWRPVERGPRRPLPPRPVERVPAKPTEPIYSNLQKPEETDIDENIQVIQKLPLFKNIVANRENKSLLSKPQMHPLHEDIQHPERKIEKKDQPKINIEENLIPEFKPIDLNNQVKLPENFIKYKDSDYQEYYDDVNLYDDYIQSNTMTNYLIEKVQELHDWVTKDPDFELKNTTKRNYSNDFSQVLKALNSSLVEGDVSIIMRTLKDIYFGELSNTSHSVISNSSDLVSFGVLSLDVMLLHNIQMMAWESQESARIKMMRDPDVFAFNALFLDPNKMETMQNEIPHSKDFGHPKHPKQDIDEDDFGRNMFKNILDIGMSTARAALHLGKAYKNTRSLLNQMTKDVQLTRDVEGNTQVLNHLQTSFNGSVANSNEFYTELDCIWLLYCRNLVATSKLNPPYGTMARINGVALRMLAGDLSVDKAIDTILYETFTGWKDLKCNDMFPRCSKVNAAAVIMEKIVNPMKKHSRG
ncbi:uncharacterized protein LOC115450710 isoform X2 [Manduca sexta]|uniref:uncharacterized protein LOC115450710 isoform X2 n=1 Tax=Manduca sexta TaxID=7130 RepID=UPI00188E5B91|nr:uncharacterized protein LOC115450710 isoform X2 [Manduca sexta]